MRSGPEQRWQTRHRVYRCGLSKEATVVDVDSGLQRGDGGESATWRRYLEPQVWMSWRSDCRSRKGDGCELRSAPPSPDPGKRRVRSQGLSGPLCNPLRCLSDGKALWCMGAVGHIPCREGSGETRPGWWLVGLALWMLCNKKRWAPWPTLANLNILLLVV